MSLAGIFFFFFFLLSRELWHQFHLIAFIADIVIIKQWSLEG